MFVMLGIGFVIGCVVFETEAFQKYSYQPDYHYAYDHCSAEEHIIIKLYTLHKAGVQPSTTLCKQVNLEKCNKTCCLENPQSPKTQLANPNRTWKSPFTGNPLKSIITRYCSIMGGHICQEQCCSSQCHQKSTQYINLRNFQNICENQHNYENEMGDQCRKQGLLVCGGDCCGFLANRNKCYQVNHYGIPYSRCPIQIIQ